MPKKQINHPILSEKEHATATGENTALVVGWNSTGWVQVGMEVDVAYAEFAINLPNGKTPRRTTLYTPVLSPAEIDDMIRTLRKAKRKAYNHDRQETEASI